MGGSVGLPSDCLPTRMIGWGRFVDAFASSLLLLVALLVDLAATAEAWTAGCWAAIIYQPEECSRRCRWRGPMGTQSCQGRCCRPSGHDRGLPHCCREHGSPSAGLWCYEQLYENLRVRACAAGAGLGEAASRTILLLAAWPTAFAGAAAFAAWWWGPPPRPPPELAEEAISVATEEFVLPSGYNKVAVIFVGEAPVAATFDTGSFRNAIDKDLLGRLEKDVHAKKAISARQACERTVVSGVTAGMSNAYEEIVGIEVSFIEGDKPQEKVKLLFVVLTSMSSSMISNSLSTRIIF